MASRKTKKYHLRVLVRDEVEMITMKILARRMSNMMSLGAETGLTDDRCGCAGPERVIELKPERDIKREANRRPKAQTEQQRRHRYAQRDCNPPSNRSAGLNGTCGRKSGRTHEPQPPVSRSNWKNRNEPTHLCAIPAVIYGAHCRGGPR